MTKRQYELMKRLVFSYNMSRSTNVFVSIVISSKHFPHAGELHACRIHCSFAVCRDSERLSQCTLFFVCDSLSTCGFERRPQSQNGTN